MSCILRWLAQTVASDKKMKVWKRGKHDGKMRLCRVECILDGIRSFQILE
jgi:hypothetical protein